MGRLFVSKSKKNRIAFLFVAVFLFLQLGLPLKVRAQSSLNACTRDAASAAQCAELFDIPAKAANNIVPFTRSVPVQAVNSAGQVLGSTSVPVSTVSGAPLALVGGVAGGIAGLGIGYLSAEGLQELQEDAFQEFCSTAANCVVPQDGFFYTMLYSYESSLDSGRTWLPKEGSTSFQFPMGEIFGEISRPYGGFARFRTQVRGIVGAPNTPTLFTIVSVYDAYNLSTALRNFRIRRFIPNTGSPAPQAEEFAQLPPSQRPSAIGTLPPQRLGDAVRFAPIPSFQIPPGTVGFRIPEIGGGIIPQGESPQLSPDAMPYLPYAPAPGENPEDNEENPSDQGGPGKSDSFPGDDEGEDVNLHVNIPQPSEFDRPNFVQYGYEVFSQKFPFDVIGNLPSRGNPDACPTFVFFQRNYTLCFVRDALSILKIPVLIGFLIWSIVNL